MTVKNLTLVCVALILVSHGSAALAQNGDRESSYTDYYRPVPPLPPDLAFTNHHASTALEGALRGQAQQIHASGNFWLSLSQAMICREQARALALGNKERWLEHSIALRKWYELDRQRRISIQRQANNARRTDRSAVHRLTDDQLDRFTGAIAWPTTLQAAMYNDLRERLNELYRTRVEYGDTSAENARQFVRCTRTFSEKLLRDRFSMSRADYLAAQKFLCGLKYEFESPVVAELRMIASAESRRLN